MGLGSGAGVAVGAVGIEEEGDVGGGTRLGAEVVAVAVERHEVAVEVE